MADRTLTVGAGLALSEATPGQTILTAEVTQAELDAVAATVTSEASTRAAADTALDTRVDALEAAPPAHTHPQSDVTGLVSDLAALDTRLDTLEAGGTGVASFNGRTGTVTAQSGDYTAAQVGAAPVSHAHAASDITIGTMATARLGSGTADGTKVLRGDSTWGAPPAGAPSGAAGGDLAGTYPDPTLAASGVVAGTYTNPTIIVDSKGRITSATSGTSGGSGSGTYTPPAYSGSFPSNSYDFTGTALPSGFATLNAIGSTQIAVANDLLTIYRPASDAVSNTRGVTWACPSGAWEYEALLYITGGGAGWQLGGFGARRGGGTAPNASNTSTDKLAYLGMGGATGPFGYGSLSGAGSNQVTSSAAFGSIYNRGAHQAARVRLAFDGVDTLTYKVAPVAAGGDTRVPPVLWKTLSAATVLGGAPDSLVLGIDNEVAAELWLGVEYVWRLS